MREDGIDREEEALVDLDVDMDVDIGLDKDKTRKGGNWTIKFYA